MNKFLKVKCPQCATVFNYYESEYRPFCCERCKMVDLGHWFEESYRVPLKETVLTEKTNEKTTNDENKNEEKSDEKNDYEEQNVTEIDQDENYDKSEYE